MGRYDNLHGDEDEQEEYFDSWDENDQSDMQYEIWREEQI